MVGITLVEKKKSVLLADFLLQIYLSSYVFLSS